MTEYKKSEKKTITAENTFTDAVRSFGSDDAEIDGLISIAGTFSATVSFQRSPDGSTYHDVETFTSANEKNFIPTKGAWYRIGVATGAYTSGTIEVVIQI